MIKKRFQTHTVTRIDLGSGLCLGIVSAAISVEKVRMKKFDIAYIEYKGGDGLVGPARIGRLEYSKSGKTIYYNGKRLQSLDGHGFKANFVDMDTGEHYWISGCKKNGGDALYNTTVEIDEDAREDYWLKIRNMPENIHITEGH